MGTIDDRRRPLCDKEGKGEKQKKKTRGLGIYWERITLLSEPYYYRRSPMLLGRGSGNGRLVGITGPVD